jgi:hypothetical protein
MTTGNKDYSTISPSAGWLVKVKSFTTIPFAKEAAGILFPENEKQASTNYLEADRVAFFKWMIHFENRYLTVETLLEETNPQHILEISSGYSFRGIDWCQRLPVHFIDTDLPEITGIKTNITNQLIDDTGHLLTGKLEVLPLNAMNRENFMDITSRFSPGPITIVNEGLLVYLNNEEKKHLCSIIYDILKQRGGYWITGDVYIKIDEDKTDNLVNDTISSFRKQHQLDQNRFDSFEIAEQFFTSAGFIIDKKISFIPEKLSAFRLLGDKKEDAITKMSQAPTIRETWRLTT